jgi:hypothetical protein
MSISLYGLSLYIRLLQGAFVVNFRIGLVTGTIFIPNPLCGGVFFTIVPSAPTLPWRVLPLVVMAIDSVTIYAVPIGTRLVKSAIFSVSY